MIFHSHANKTYLHKIKGSHLASFWKWQFLELGNGLFTSPRSQSFSASFGLGGLATTLHFLITDCNAGLNVNDLNTDRCLTFYYKSELNVIDYKYNLNT